MKLLNLNETYLRGIIDMLIVIYNDNIKGLDEDKGLTYKFEYGATGGETETVKITFEWSVGTGIVYEEKETDFREEKRTLETDYFTLVKGERMNKIESYVNDVMDKVTNY